MTLPPTLETGFTRRNAARIARPTTAMPMIVVTARRVSQPAVVQRSGRD
ncbi:hypothetical protein QFZ36_001989 [Pseudarthrobacter siccitolerans]|uniref:Uncharacterized protein n=1 Tax=Pseudarthrobacter siccitolerans TaxID=861266 RepID=A0ABU0PKD5_9MICC|nr:hypothetical protein [Pseudarthrobacter siccitolerans]MDQ0674428.1 hypothetical protein [Pseudarthrobacter siccitolerans]